MTQLRVAFRTLGCKLNQLEGESIAQAFLDSGARLVDFDEKAELYVLNTCTVTGKAEQKARRSMRQAAAQNPVSVVLVTGCYAQMDPEGLSLVSPRTIVVPGDEKTSLLRLADWLSDNWQGHGDLYDAVLEWEVARRSPGGAGESDPFAFHPRSFVYHSRPSLKVQDGCNNRCAYCRVCIARGLSRSLDPRIALARAIELEASGGREAVLTGVNLSQYRWGEMRFPGLLEFLIANTDSLRFRISSWEPDQVDEAFLRAFSLPRIQPHLHLSLQSGCDAELRRMGRPYTAAAVAKAVQSLRDAKDDPFLAADIISGFPDQTDTEHAQTMELLHSLDLAWIHAFPFSARPGTRAFDMKPKVPERLAGERVADLCALAETGRASYISRWMGRRVPAILEKSSNRLSGDEVSTSGRGSQGIRHAVSANYLKLGILGVPEDRAPGSEVMALIQGSSGRDGVDESLDAEAAWIFGSE
ncbi:MAG TPA: tRNA (N(6)-L-threonylcarbamoyladenosine(37)-C(2))-methylthiotransferase MtaB [Rectinemataceae bacterium]